jgi:protein ImuB
VRPLVRRIYTTPLPLASGAGLQALASDFPKAQGLTPKAIFGPYIVSGGWWGGGVHRDYYFAHTNSGELQWLYYDRRRQCFFLQGQVE